MSTSIAAGCAGLESAPRSGAPSVSERSVNAAGTVEFASGTLIIPLDGQPDEIDVLPSYGLVYDLLKSNVPVQWVIKDNKAARDDFDLQIGSGVTVSDFHGNAPITRSAQYQGSVFLIDASDAAAAAPRIQAWQAAHPKTAVHVVAGTFMAHVTKTLTAAPSIAVLDNGKAGIATRIFNTAGIPNSSGAPWAEADTTSPGSFGLPLTGTDILSTDDVAGTSASNKDGKLWNADGTSRYCQLFSMHYDNTTKTDEVVAEVRAWLQAAKGNHAFMQCSAIEVFENNVNGKFLSTGGLLDETDGNQFNPEPKNLVVAASESSDPVIQPTAASSASRAGSLRCFLILRTARPSGPASSSWSREIRRRPAARAGGC